jgi:hypothetical protein
MSWEENQLNSHLYKLEAEDDKEHAIGNLADLLEHAAVAAMRQVISSSVYDQATAADMQDAMGDSEFFYDLAAKTIKASERG